MQSIWKKKSDGGVIVQPESWTDVKQAERSLQARAEKSNNQVRK